MSTRREPYPHAGARLASPVTLFALIGLLAAGCDKIQIPQMGGGQQAAPPAPVAPVAAPPAQAEAAPAAMPVATEPAKPDHKAAVEAFLQKAKTTGLTDSDLIAVTDLEGVEGLDQVAELRLSGVEITDAGVSRLGKFNKLARLDMSSSKVTNNGIQVIKDLPELESLKLTQTAADDRIMPVIAAHSGIKELVLSSTALSDFGLNELEKMQQLESLDISSTGINGAGFEHFKGNKKFKSLIARKTGFQGEALKFLVNCPMEVLELDETPITDRSMKYIGRMKNLKRLSIGFTGISDLGINQLGVMKDLEYINVRNDAKISNLLFKKLMTCKNLKYVCSNGTMITNNDCAKLAKLIPGVEIAN